MQMTLTIATTTTTLGSVTLNILHVQKKGKFPPFLMLIRKGSLKPIKIIFWVKSLNHDLQN